MINVGRHPCFLFKIRILYLQGDMSNIHRDGTYIGEVLKENKLTVFSYKSIDEVIKRANDSPFGLASSVFGNNMDEINTIMQRMRTGSVWVNCYFVISPQVPFGGYKMSGIGREGGAYGIRDYTEIKAVFVKTSTKNS